MLKSLHTDQHLQVIAHTLSCFASNLPPLTFHATPMQPQDKDAQAPFQNSIAAATDMNRLSTGMTQPSTFAKHHSIAKGITAKSYASLEYTHDSGLASCRHEVNRFEIEQARSPPVTVLVFSLFSKCPCMSLVYLNNCSVDKAPEINPP